MADGSRRSTQAPKVIQDLHTAQEEHKFLDDISGGGFPEGGCLRVLGGIVQDDQNVFVAPEGFRSGPTMPTLLKCIPVMQSGMSGMGASFLDKER